MSEIISRTDFAYFISITVPDAGPEELRACFDWGNWVRFFACHDTSSCPLFAFQFIHV